MKLTDYAERRLPEHGITEAHVREALNNVAAGEVQDNGRYRVWGWVEELGYYVRVILLPDGETILNAFRDSSFTRKHTR